jgi:hypothetical protein
MFLSKKERILFEISYIKKKIKQKLRSILQAFSMAIRGESFLCDSCAYDHPNTCSHPQRPNVRSCSEYKRRGKY